LLLMPARPRESWRTYCDTIGDRSELFALVREFQGTTSALYPGSYLDLAPSTAIPSVTYVDTDARAAAFFGDTELVQRELRGCTLPGAATEIVFHRLDYRQPLPLGPMSCDLLISLYAGPVWDNCRRYVSAQGLLLANASHGDASLAALDPAVRLVAVIHQRSGRYRLDTDRLGEYLVPKRPEAADPEAIRRRGRGIAYTTSAFAYLFQVV
jgi:hypothetical protein